MQNSTPLYVLDRDNNLVL